MKMTKTNIQLILALSVALVVSFLVFSYLNRRESNDLEIATLDSIKQGSLVMNTDKHHYLTGEVVTINIASLDENGQTNCNSNLFLEVVNAKEQNEVKMIEVINSPTCDDDSVTNDPDYFATYTPSATGSFNIVLTNLDTNQSIETGFEVSKNLKYEVQRTSATRANTSESSRYPMLITIKANQDLSGTISDSIPEGFQFVWQGAAKVENNKITWEVDLKAGETKTFSYEYQAQEASSNSSTFGPVYINNESTSNFWEIALNQD